MKRPLTLTLASLSLALIVLVAALAVLPTFAAPQPSSMAQEQALPDGPDGTSKQPSTSRRLIVELESPPLTVWNKETGEAMTAAGRLDMNTAAAQAYEAQLQAEQATFINNMRSALPGATVSTYVNEDGALIEESFRIVLNAVVVDPGDADQKKVQEILAALPGVKAVYKDYLHTTDLYASTFLIDAPAIWNSAAVGGRANGGKGVKIASVDGGVHHDAPMFDGTGFSYPPDFPAGGLGLKANNNGKIIASRVYFRPWDPPTPGDQNPWPGENGTPHGNHTAGIAGGNIVDATYAGYHVGTISGVAPGAWIMSYRVFYADTSGLGSAYSAEIAAALEDVVRDGADVVNNSWGAGPKTVGGELDVTDRALINTAKAGVFVAMSAGNSGPGNGTTDHPSDDYIIAAASTTSGTLASGRLSVVAPEPVSPTLQSLAFAAASFGAPLPIGTVITHSFVSAASVDPANFEGCSPWTGTPFAGKAALISRGTCEFGTKVLNAENGGAVFVVVYNHAQGGESLVTMAPGQDGGQVTIPSIFVGHTDGTAMVDWYAQHGDTSVLRVNTIAFQAGNTADRIASFSSRGPGVGNVLKPDIAAPGVNILSQGYTPGATGEARHLGYGQASGTSMSAPHVAGAAALLRQVHPNWSNAYIKSALMSTAKYMDVYNFDETPAQPLDMGAGRLDLTHAADPGVILSPPSVSFGLVPTGTMESLTVRVTNITSQAETYNLSTLYTGDGFTMTTTLPGFNVTPGTVSLDPGSSAVVTVDFNPAAGMGFGDNQGYIILDGDVHDAHLPAWARVTPATGTADVLLIDNDGSSSLDLPDYQGYYTRTLEALSRSYDVLDADALAGTVEDFVPDAATLSGYEAIIYFTGDNFYPDGFFTVPTPLTQIDMDRLTEYANNGGIIIAMGQDMASVLQATDPANAPIFYGWLLGGNYLQDSVTANALPDLPVGPLADAPEAFHGISLDLSGPKTTTVDLFGANEVPPVATTTYGEADFQYDAATHVLNYSVMVKVSDPVTITAAHVHSGTVGVGGPVLYPTFPFTSSVMVTDTLAWDGEVVIGDVHVAQLLAGDLYFNIHTTAHPGGEIRGQVMVQPSGDGAGNQVYVDEISLTPNPTVVDDDLFDPQTLLPFMPLLRYPGPDVEEDGLVAMAHRDQPTLERPGITYYGRSVYTTFGLEGVNDGIGATDRAGLLDTFWKWALDEPAVTISDTTLPNASNLTTFQANVTSSIADATGTKFRWDFGDGSGFVGPFDMNVASHQYEVCRTYTVRVEAVDSYGNRAIGTQEVNVDENCATYLMYMPLQLN